MLARIAALLTLAVAVAAQTTAVTVPQSRYWEMGYKAKFRKNIGPQLPKYTQSILTPQLARHSAAYDAVNDRILAFGGDPQDGDAAHLVSQVASNRLVLFDIKRNQWYTEPAFFNTLPPARYDHASWTSGDTLWIHGGFNGKNSLNDVWTYRNRTWKKVAQPKSPLLSGHSVNWVGGTSYLVFGGRTDRTFSNNMYLFNGTFSRIATFGNTPTARAYHATAVLNNTYKGLYIYMMGGFDGSTGLSDLYAFDIRKKSWKLLNKGSSPSRRSYEGVLLAGVSVPGMMRHSCGIVFPSMLCIGGEGTGRATIVEYDVFLDRWLPTTTANPTEVPPVIMSKSFTRFSDEGGVWEHWFVGGMTGSPAQFRYNRTGYVALMRTAALSNVCPSSYVSPDFAGRCFKCATGSAVNFQQNPHSCTSCPRGTYGKYGECRLCPKGTYQPKNGTTNATSCLTCPPGYFTQAAGARSFGECLSCPIGTYSNGNGCSKCPAGTYGIASGQGYLDTACLPCPYGTFSDEGALNCTTCGPGSASGPFINRIRPYRLILSNMGAVVPPQTAVGGCGSAVLPTQVVAGTWFYVVVAFADFGEDGTYRPYYPMRRDGNTQPYLVGAGSATAEYDGPHAKMYYTCTDQALIASCPSVRLNQTTPAVTTNPNLPYCVGPCPWSSTPCTAPCVQLPGFCNVYLQFALRFDETSLATKITIRSSTNVPVSITVAVVAFGTAVNISGTPAAYVMLAGAPMSFLALDLLNVYDPTATGTFTISVRCATGTITPTFKLSSTSYAASQTLTFVGGKVSDTFTFNAPGQKCNFLYVRNAVATTTTQKFDIQNTTSLKLILSSSNVTSGGVIRATALILNSTGDVVTGDSFTSLRLDLDAGRPYNSYITIQESRVVRVTNGIGTFVYHVSSSFPLATPIPQIVFVLSVVSGISPPPTPVTSPLVKIYTPVQNGTAIRILTDRYPFPSLMMLNQSFTMEISVVDVRSAQVTSWANPTLMFEVVNCPMVRLTVGNSSLPYLTLLSSYGVVKVTLRGQDPPGSCNILVRQLKVTNPRTTPRAAWSANFTIRTPYQLNHTAACTWGKCTQANCKIAAGTTQNISVFTVSSTGALCVNDYVTVVQLLIVGNASAVQELTGAYSKRVSGGTVTFSVRYLPSAVPVQILFVGGFWTQQDIVNKTTFAKPFFRATYQKLGTALIFNGNSIKRAGTCAMTLFINTTRIAVTSRVPSWFPNDEPITFEIEARDDFGNYDRTYQGPYYVFVYNCFHGLASDLTWSYFSPATATYITLSTPTVLGFFSTGRHRFTLVPKYNTQTNFTNGVRGCSIRVTSSILKPLLIENFQVRKVFPACVTCPPGSWSSGGTGVTATTTYHPGGCVPCPYGSFATKTGAVSAAVCQLCPSGTGISNTNWNAYLSEGVTRCTGVCAFGSAVPANGGVCSPNTISALAPMSLDPFFSGRLGQLCGSSVCTGQQNCNPGQFYLNCANEGSGTCAQKEHKGNCFWNTTANACQGPSRVCLPCPAGTTNPFFTTGSFTGGACARCHEGGWSANEGLTGTQTDQTTIQYEPFRAGFSTYTRFCFGAGTGLCPNGTYSNTRGAINSTTCLKCPKGQYAHQRTYYQTFSCGEGYPCALTAFTNPFQNWGTSCFACRLAEFPRIVGANRCIPCPPGTYNNITGAWDPFLHCIPCPAGTYCPGGTAEPIWTDTLNTNSYLVGTVQPYAVSMDKNSQFTLCNGVALSNYIGYVNDGTFSQFLQRNYLAVDNIDASFQEAWHYEPKATAKYTVVTTDRLGSATSGAARCNATGCAFFQTIMLRHELPIDLIARLWVQNNLHARNYTSRAYQDSMKHTPYNAQPFAGFTLRLYDNVNLTIANSLVYKATIPFSLTPTGTWSALEINVSPPFAVKVAQFNISTDLYYQGYALFDDAQLRPGRKWICNCSTGFYYNSSAPGVKHCRRCPPGFACSGGVLTRCENSWSVSAQPGCTQCRSSWQCDADGRGRSIPCALYTKKDNLTETCSPCPLGYACADGNLQPCSGGTYGDGGLNCVNCLPGFYSLPGAAVRECTRCPPGTSANYMQTGCDTCEVNQYSADGLACLQCPQGTFATYAGSASCTPCTSLVLGNFNYTVYRNSVARLSVIPQVCVELYDWAIDSVHYLTNQQLSTVAPSASTPDSVRFEAGSTVGNQTFYVLVTSALNAQLQRSTITVTIANRYPFANDDNLVVSHPTTATTLDLTFTLFNDFDPDADNVYFAAASLVPGTYSYGANAITISSDRRGMSLALPVGFQGPTRFQYSVMDKYRATTAACLPPSCKMSWNAIITIVARDSPPTASADSYQVIAGTTFVFDVVANDVDPDGDDITITAVTASAFAGSPQIVTVCSGCGACLGVPSCTCATDANRANTCWPSTGRLYAIQYTPPTTRCGTDSFSYTITTNDGVASASVSAKITQCYCSTHPFGIDIVFALDATTDAESFKWQMTLADAIQDRSAQLASFRYALFGVGQSTRWQNLTTSYFQGEFIDPNYNGANFPFAMGKSFTQIGDGTATSVLGVPSARRAVVVIITGHDSTDSVLAPASAVANLYPNGFYTVVLSVNPGAGDFSFVQQLNPIYKKAVRNFISQTELQNPQIAYDVMDAICSLP